MRSIRWLHISDIHMSVREAWSQDVVLTAMCEQIGQQRCEGVVTDFILLTGDLAFSGKADEYVLVAEFLDALCTAAQVPKECVFCVPGNHDIDRDRQTLCFMGARTYLQDQNRIDAVLTGGDNLATLLQRQQAYRQFQETYFSGQERVPTADGLGYVSRLTIKDVRLAILGLDSAWLACGGVEDSGKLLVGERQAIEALRLEQENDDPAHIVIAIAHHPFHLLHECDRQRVTNRIERICQFLHCGHLHEPETRTTISGATTCLTLGAGALYETRQSHNSYLLVTLDLLGGMRSVATHQFDPKDGTFSFTTSTEYRIEVIPTETCSFSELADAIRTYDSDLAAWAYYLSALLLERKAELPVPTANGHTFASFAVLEEMPDSELKSRTSHFLTFRNVLRVLYGRTALADIFAQHGVAVAEYGATLRQLCKTDAPLGARLDAQEDDSRLLASTTPASSSAHTSALLSELADAQDWTALRELAERHSSSPDTTIAKVAKRMLALALANSQEVSDKDTAITLYQSLIDDSVSDATDFGNLATLLIASGRMDEARPTVLAGINKFPKRADYFGDIGHRIVESTGDKEFRQQIETALAGKGIDD